MINFFLSLLFPSSCFSCRAQGSAVCEACLSRARKAISSPSPFIVPVFDYHDPLIRRAIHAMKFFGRKDIAVSLSSELAKCARSFPGHQSYILVPIPMPRLRKYVRGYNQSEVLAEHIASACSMRTDPSLLTRATSPKRQVEVKNRHNRLANQKGTFSCGSVQGKRILLIDDVTTTGATLTEARRALLRAGAADVRALTLAH